MNKRTMMMKRQIEMKLFDHKKGNWCSIQQKTISVRHYFLIFPKKMIISCTEKLTKRRINIEATSHYSLDMLAKLQKHIFQIISYFPLTFHRNDNIDKHLSTLFSHRNLPLLRTWKLKTAEKSMKWIIRFMLTLLKISIP